MAKATEATDNGDKGLGREEPSVSGLNKSRARERKHSLQLSLTPPGWPPCGNAAVGSAVKMYINIGAF